MGLFHSYMKSVSALLLGKLIPSLCDQLSAFSTSGSSVISSCETRNFESSPMFWWCKFAVVWVPGGIFYFPTMTSMYWNDPWEIWIHEVSWLDLAGDSAICPSGNWCRWSKWPRIGASGPKVIPIIPSMPLKVILRSDSSVTEKNAWEKFGVWRA